MTHNATFLAGLALGLSGNTLNALIDDATRQPFNFVTLGLRAVLFGASLLLAGAAYVWGDSEPASRRLWWLTWAGIFVLLAVLGVIGGTNFVSGLTAH